MGGITMTIWKKKRQTSGLSRTDMANELGLDYGRYASIERGDVKMPSNLIDKFNEIINRGKENELTRVQNTAKADEFWEEVKQQREDGTYILIEKMRELNIPNRPTLVKLLGYSSTGTVYNYLQGKNNVGPEFKKRLYNFFNDETNIQIPTKVIGKSETGKKRTREKTVNKRLDRYYEKTDFKKILKEHKITNVQIEQAIGVHNSTVSNMTCKKFKPSYKVIGNVKKYLDNILAEPVVSEPTFPEIPKTDVTEFVPNYFEEPMAKKSNTNDVVSRYESELADIEDVIEMYNSKIKELEIRKKICVEVLAAIKEFTTIPE